MAKDDKQPASPVEPIKVIRTKLEQGNEEAERVTVYNSANLQDNAPATSVDEHPGFQKPKNPDTLQYCWNCNNQGKQTKLKDGVCPECGFELDKLHNGQLEIDKHVYRGSLAASQG